MSLTHVALLRAINVGGRAVVRMTDLRAAFERARCRNVRTFIASGNVVFETSGELPAAARRRIATELRELLGAEPGVCYRRLDELEELIAADPFGGLGGDTTLKLYVAFMDRIPQPMPRLPILDPKELVEMIAMRAADMLLVSRRKPNGMYGFPNALVERLGVTATTRNWNTVTKLVAFARRRQ